MGPLEDEGDEDGRQGLTWEVRVGGDGTIRLAPEFVGAFLRDRLRWESESRSKCVTPRKPSTSASPGEPRSPETFSPDAFVDQRSGLVDKRMYLRLARENAFASKKIGKRIVARWGDVQAALAPAPAPPSGSERSDEDPELDAIRAQVGLRVRGGR